MYSIPVYLCRYSYIHNDNSITDLGKPIIALNCTTNYAAPARSINVTWLLNSTNPSNFYTYGLHRVGHCLAIVSCTNGNTTLEVGT